MSTAHELRCEATVLIHVRDDAPADWLSRVTTFPYCSRAGDPMTEADGLEMLVYNALRNGVHDASWLGGWRDLERGMVELEVIDVEVAP